MTPFGLRKLDKVRREPAYLECDELPDPASIDRVCVRLGRVRIGTEAIEICDGVELNPSIPLGTVLFREILKHVVRAGVCTDCEIADYDGDVVVSSLEVCLARWEQDFAPEHRVPFSGGVDLTWPARVVLAPDAPVTYKIRVPGQALVETRTLPPLASP